MNNQQQNPWEAQMQNLAYKEAYDNYQRKKEQELGWNSMLAQGQRPVLGAMNTSELGVSAAARQQNFANMMAYMGQARGYQPFSGGKGGGGGGGGMMYNPKPELSIEEGEARDAEAVARKDYAQRFGSY